MGVEAAWQDLVSSLLLLVHVTGGAAIGGDTSAELAVAVLELMKKQLWMRVGKLLCLNRQHTLLHTLKLP